MFKKLSRHKRKKSKSSGKHSKTEAEIQDYFQAVDTGTGMTGLPSLSQSRQGTAKNQVVPHTQDASTGIQQSDLNSPNNLILNNQDIAPIFGLNPKSIVRVKHKKATGTNSSFIK